MKPLADLCTAVRGKRGRYIHYSLDLRNVLCGVRIGAFIVEPDAAVTCLKCHIAATTN